MNKEKTESPSLNLGLVLLFAFAHLGHHLPGALITPLSPFIRNDFSLDYTLWGWVASSYLICYGVSQLPGGWLADRFGPRIVITIGISGVAVAGLLAGLAVNYVMLLVCLAFAGVLGGGYHPSSVPLISKFTDPQKRGRALGLHQIGGAASHFLAPLIAGALVIIWGWRGAFIGPSILIFLFGIVFNILLSRQNRSQDTQNEMVAEEKNVLSYTKEPSNLTAFLIFAIVGDFLLGATVVFIPLFLIDHFQFSDEVAAATLAVVYSGGLWAGPLAGYLSDLFGSVRVLIAISLLVSPIIFFFNMLPYGWPAYLFLLVIGMVQYARMPVNETYLISRTSEKNRSTILGIYYFGSRGGPGVLAPLVGFLTDQFGFGISLGAIGITMFLITVCCGVFIRKDTG